MSRFKLSKWFQRNFKNERETLDPTPVEMPLGMHRPLSIQETIAKYIQTANYVAQMSGAETFEEAEDFDVDDEMDPSSPWEREFDPLSGKEMYRGERRFMDQSRAEFDRQYAERLKNAPKKTPKKSKKASEDLEAEED